MGKRIFKIFFVFTYLIIIFGLVSVVSTTYDELDNYKYKKMSKTVDIDKTPTKIEANDNLMLQEKKSTPINENDIIWDNNIAPAKLINTNNKMNTATISIPDKAAYVHSIIGIIELKDGTTKITLPTQYITGNNTLEWYYIAPIHERLQTINKDEILFSLFNGWVLLGILILFQYIFYASLNPFWLFQKNIKKL